MSGLGLLTTVFLVLPALMSIYLGMYSWRRRSIPGAISFTFTMFATASWSLTAALVVLNSDAGVASGWLRANFAIGALLSVGILAAAAQTTGHTFMSTPTRMMPWLLIPAITILLTITGNSHHWYLYDIRFVQSGSQNIGWMSEYGPYSVVHLTYSYGLIAYGIVLLVQQLLKLHYNNYRIRILLLLVGLLLPFVANIANSLFVETRTFVTPIMLNLSAPIFYWVLFRYRLFDLLPIARDQAFEQMDDAVIIVNEQNLIVDVNPKAALLAHQLAPELIEKSLSDVYPVYQEAFTRALDGTSRHQSIQIDSGEQPMYFDLSVIPIIRDDEQVGKLIVLADRTEQRLAEDRARHVEAERDRIRSLSEFVGAASHEFRTPLAVIKNSAYLINRIEDPTKRAEKTAQIDNQVNILTRLIDGLLTVVRLDAQVDLTFHALDINIIVQGIEQKARVDAAAKNLHLELQVASHLPLISGNTSYLQEAIQAVLHNAIRYTPPGGTVTLRTSQRDNKTVVTVQDTGIGIEPEHLPRIFDVFYRVDTARSTSGFGTGLTIANRVITLHGGGIEISSEPGNGTTVDMTFPPANTPESKTVMPRPVSKTNGSD